MKKYGLIFTWDRCQEALSTFGLMAIGSIIGLIMALKYSFSAVFLGSLVTVIVCSLILSITALKQRRSRIGK